MNKRKLYLWLLPVLVLLRLSAQSITPVAEFQSEDPRLWKSGEVPARLQRTTQGIELPLLFPSDNRQITLTRGGSWNLEDLSSFRLRVGISDSAVLLEANLAFKSGNGWYTHGFTLHEEGPAHLLFAKANFNTEGAVAGWDRIEAVRISFWPRKAGTTTLYPMSLEGFQDDLWILDTESAAKTGDETYTARVSKRHQDRILTGLGLPHAIYSLDALPARGSPRLILIPYLPHLSDREFQRLSRFMDRGCRLIVFESGHAGLARKMGVQLGDTLSSSTVGQFNHLLLDTALMPGAPSKIYQHAWSMRGIQPLSGSRVVARWADALDRPLPHASAIESANGIWVNVAWRSGDTDAKQQLLGEWIGKLAPSLLTESLRYHRETRSPRVFERRHGRLDSNAAPARALKTMAERSHEAASAQNDDPRSAFRLFRQSEQLMQRAYASSQSPWNARVKGIWDQNGTGFYAGSWDRTCRALRAAGFNAVFANMASAGRAHYPSRLIPPSKTLEQHGDQLRAFATAAKQNGLEAHAWKICWKLNTRLPAFEAQLRREGRLMRDQNGNDLPWLSISDPRNVQFEIASLLEMARHAELDGIHLDYMRYPGREADYGPAARKAFEAQLGRRIPNWPADVLGGPLQDRYQRFRQQEVHNAMRNISAAVRKEFPDLKLSVAVWGAWPDCADSQGQDWPVWAREEWVDWIIPMNYTDNPDQLAGWLDLQAAQPGVRQRLIPGLGYISSNAELTPAQLLDQLTLIRERNLPGAVLYRLDSSLAPRLFPYLTLWE